MTAKTNGKTNNTPSFEDLYELQKCFQIILINAEKYDNTDINLPYDDCNIFKQHILHLVAELGEVLQADKRWKQYRNGYYNREEKINELADCFVLLLNTLLFSGIKCDEYLIAVKNKIGLNFARFKDEQSVKEA